MQTEIFIAMLNDKGATDYKKMLNKYGEQNFCEYIDNVKSGFMRTIPLLDFTGKPCYYLPTAVPQLSQYSQALLRKNYSAETQSGLEIEIAATLAIESVATSRASIRSIMDGYAPKDEAEKKILGIKHGLEFVADRSNLINTYNFRELYRVVVEETLGVNERLNENRNYRHDEVFVVGLEVEHKGINSQKLTEYMDSLFAFLDDKTDGIDFLHKSMIAHYYLAYLHPYFDGNGRMARLLQQWYLLKNGWDNAITAALSLHINNSRQAYYKAFTLIESNRIIADIIDITPFIKYFSTKVFAKIKLAGTDNVIEEFKQLVQAGSLTEKERDLFEFVLQRYKYDEFSTKQLERDFGNAAYATIRSFVLSFTEKGLLESLKLSSKTKYKIRQ